MPIHVEVISQEKKLFEETEADIVIAPGTEGLLGILPNHSPLLTTMDFGELVVRKGNAEERFAIFGGVLEVRPDKVLVLADAADFTENLSIERAHEARQRVQKLIEEGIPHEEQEFYAKELRKAQFSEEMARKAQARPHSVGIRVLEGKTPD